MEFHGLGADMEGGCGAGGWLWRNRIGRREPAVSACAQERRVCRRRVRRKRTRRAVATARGMSRQAHRGQVLERDKGHGRRHAGRRLFFGTCTVSRHSCGRFAGGKGETRVRRPCVRRRPGKVHCLFLALSFRDIFPVRAR